MLDSRTALADRLTMLGELLGPTRPLWHPRPFVHLAVDWEADHPEVARWLRRQDSPLDGLSQDALHAALDDAPAELRAWRDACRAATMVPALGRTQAFPREHLRRIKAYKQAQITAFAAAAPRCRRVVELCAGKGHLARLIALRDASTALLIERDPALADEARARLAEAGVKATVVTGDVRDWRNPDPEDLVLGLHACGDLTDHLVQHAGEARCLSVGCCFDRRQSPFTALSATGAASDPGIDAQGLRLASLAAAYKTPRMAELVRRESAWRLGLDLLLREAHGRDAYTPVGTLPRSVRALDFADFVRRVAADKALTLPPRWDPDQARRAGQERMRQTASLCVVRRLFARPLELWVALDRAMYLAERGRQVTVRTFCASTVTPRNLLVSAI